jgi:hypothetical protein
MKWILGVAILGLLPAAFLHERDMQTAETARVVTAQISSFCADNHRPPDKREFASMFPDIPLGTEWYYWPAADGRQVSIQYQVAFPWHQRFPGKPKTSEFTATTYAYVISIACETMWQ